MATRRNERSKATEHIAQRKDHQSGCDRLGADHFAHFGDTALSLARRVLDIVCGMLNASGDPLRSSANRFRNAANH